MGAFNIYPKEINRQILETRSIATEIGKLAKIIIDTDQQLSEMNGMGDVASSLDIALMSMNNMELHTSEED